MSLLGKPNVPRYAIVECACGVAYSRREVTLPIKDIGSFECVECGARLEIWCGRTVPAFTRVGGSVRPQTDVSKAS